MTRTAECCCKAISITLEGEPQLNGLCHCDNCKRRTGSAFGWSAYFADEQVKGMTGTAASYEVDAEQTRYFCKACGTTLYWKTGLFQSLTGVAGGCFTTAPLPAPSASYRHDQRCAWVELPQDWSFHS